MVIDQLHTKIQTVQYFRIASAVYTEKLESQEFFHFSEYWFEKS